MYVSRYIDTYMFIVYTYIHVLIMQLLMNKQTCSCTCFVSRICFNIISYQSPFFELFMLCFTPANQGESLKVPLSNLIVLMG